MPPAGPAAAGDAPPAGGWPGEPTGWSAGGADAGAVYPSDGAPWSSGTVPATPPPGSPFAPVPGPPARRRSRLAVLGVVVACVLVVAVGVQAVVLVRTNTRLDDARHTATAQHRHDAKRIKALEGTVSGLEHRVKKSLDAAAVSKKVLPSIFQVVAGDYTGSSFVVGGDDDGSYLLTNDHVVQPLLDSGRSTVKLERGTATFTAKVVKHDKSLDVAVLHSDESFPVLTIADSPVQPGQPVVVIGSPLGLNDSVTTGVVSSTHRDVSDSEEKYIQFDAAINPGNSGGPVMDAKGHVVGIATAKARDAEGIGLAIPISVPCDRYSVCGA